MYGDHWQSQVAHELGVRARRVRHWNSTDRPVPDEIWPRLKQLLIARATYALRIAQDVDRSPSGAADMNAKVNDAPEASGDKYESDQWLCTECRAVSSGPDVLYADNPFDNTDTVAGCPACASVDCIIKVCDESGCAEPATCGFPAEDVRYRHTCGQHYRKSKENQ